MIVSWGCYSLLPNIPKKLIVSVTVLVISVLFYLTSKQVTYWKNDYTLFSHAINVTKDNYFAYNSIGVYLEQSGQTNESIVAYSKAIAINPTFEDAHYNLATLYMRIGRLEDAIKHYRIALNLNPGKIVALNNLAAVYVRKGRIDEAIPLVQKALELAQSTKNEAMVRDLTGNLNALKTSNITFEEKK
jgi:tetratricopeptide (TPR) repeat protein